MAVNRFMSPVKAQYFQTYVDQFVPLPFDLMQRKADAEQKRFDAVKAEGQKLMASVNEDFIRTDQDPLLSSKIDEVRNAVSQGVEGYNGDWRSMDGLVANLGADYTKWITTEEGALAKSNKIDYDKNQAAIQESTMTAQDKELGAEYSYRRYDAQGGAINGVKYQPVAPYDLKDFNEKALGIIKTMDPSQQSVSSSGYNEGKDLIVTFHRDVTELTKGRISAALKAGLYNDQNFNDMVGYRYEIYSKMYPKIAEMSYDEFKESVYQSMFGGYAEPFAYEQEEERTDAKETHKAEQTAIGEREDQQNAPPVTNFSANYVFGKNPLADQMANPENGDQVDVLKNSYNVLTNDFLGRTGGSNSPLFMIFQKSYPGADLNEYNSMMNGVAAKHNIDLRNPYGQRKFIEGLATGKFDNDFISLGGTKKSLILNKTSAEYIRQVAKKQLTDLQDLDDLNVELVRGLAQNGYISNEKFNEYKTFVQGVDGTIQLLEKAKQENPKEAKNIDAQIEALYTQRISMGSVYGTGYLDLPSTKPNYELIEKYTKRKLPPIVSVFDAGIFEDEENREYLNKELSSRYSTTQSISVTGTNGLYSGRTNSQGQPIVDTKYIATLQKYYKENPNLLLNSRVYGSDQKGEVFLRDLIHDEAVKLSGVVSGPTYEKAKQDLINTAHEGMMLSNTLNPINNSPMMTIMGGRYTMDLSGLPGHVNNDIMNHIGPQQYREMRMNTYIANSLQSPVKTYRVTPDGSVRIVSIKPQSIDASVVLKNNADNSVSVVEIDPALIGRNPGTTNSYSIIDAENGRLLVEDIEQLKEKAAADNGYITLSMTENGKQVQRRVTLDEAIKLKVKHYSKVGTFK